MKLDQIVQTLENNEVELQNLKDSLSEDYLTRAYAFAYIIEQNPEVLGSQSELERIARLLNVDELPWLLMKTASCLQEAFRCILVWIFMIRIRQENSWPILEDPDSYLVQDIRPNGYEQKVFQYIGVARKDQKGIVQVGMAPIQNAGGSKEKPVGVYIVAYAPGFRDYAFYGG